MRIRLSHRTFESCSLDELDKFLIREIESRDGLHLLELVERFPGEPADAMMRVHRLASMEILELTEYAGHRHELEATPLHLSSLVPALVLSDVPAITVRPAQDPYSAVTARPPQPLPIADMFMFASDTQPARAPSMRPSLVPSVPVENSGTRKLCREAFKITLVDEDNETRAESCEADEKARGDLKCVS